MPRDRKKKQQSPATKRYKTVKDLPEDRKNEYQTLMDDFDKQVEERLLAMENELISCQQEIRQRFRIQKLALSSEVRKQCFEDSVELSLIPMPFSSVPTSSDKSKVQEQISQIQESATKDRTNVKIQDRAQNVEAGSTPSARDRGRRGRKEKLLTPDCSAALQKNSITLKFNSDRPPHKSVMRVARPSETLVSLNGSPVYVPPAGAKKSGRCKKKVEERFTIPLGDGRALAVPTDTLNTSDSTNCLVNLDENDKTKLHNLRKNIDSLLQ